jgi:putative membrane protein|tara:strand:+ start:5906 stop:6406 length:501 start_codon:yes stop_codon:yes gene_type:complete
VIATLLKAAHILAIGLWAAGLLSLPLLFAQRRGLENKPLYDLHNFTRFLYVAIVSPAAFVAIASGTGLIFVEATFTPWFSVKLAFVGAMVLIHVTTGLVILRLFEPGQRYSPLRLAITMVLTGTVIASILIVVLGKPELMRFGPLDDFFAPGALGQGLPDSIAWWR